MADAAPPVECHYLQPAEAVLSQTRSRMRTVLGSCVAITMRAPRLGYAAMVHCVLPRAGVAAAALRGREALRYVDTAVEILLDAFRRHGARVEELEVKLFGGADGLAGQMPEGGYAVGRKNIAAARDVLKAKGIVPVAARVGGRNGRMVEFDTGTGEVCVRTLRPRAGEAMT